MKKLITWWQSQIITKIWLLDKSYINSLLSTGCLRFDHPIFQILASLKPNYSYTFKFRYGLIFKIGFFQFDTLWDSLYMIINDLFSSISNSKNLYGIQILIGRLSQQKHNFLFSEPDKGFSSGDRTSWGTRNVRWLEGASSLNGLKIVIAEQGFNRLTQRQV